MLSAPASSFSCTGTPSPAHPWFPARRRTPLLRPAPSTTDQNRQPRRHRPLPARHQSASHPRQKPPLLCTRKLAAPGRERDPHRRNPDQDPMQQSPPNKTIETGTQSPTHPGNKPQCCRRYRLPEGRSFRRANLYMLIFTIFLTGREYAQGRVNSLTWNSYRDQRLF